MLRYSFIVPLSPMADFIVYFIQFLFHLPVSVSASVCVPAQPCPGAVVAFRGLLL